MTDPYKLQYATAGKDSARRQAIVALCAQRSLAINVAVIGTILGCYGVGLALIVQATGWMVATGAAAILAAMVMAWYLSHDCAHLLVFRGRRPNYLLGEVLSWINGVGYFRFAEYCRFHIQHHNKQVDFIGVDVAGQLARGPRWLTRTMMALEGAYLPAMHGFVKLAAIVAVLREPDRSYHRRVVLVVVLNAAFFVGLTVLSPVATACYLGVICVRIHCIRFVDAFQHSYTQVDPAAALTPKGKHYEQHHTFSFPVARKLTALNLLILNFGYHNAHHAFAGCPWYNLPALDALLTSDGPASPIPQLPFGELVRGYHRHRRYRITTTDEGQAYDDALRFSMTKFTGAFTDNLLG